jgi:Ser/Thr protein kinase RdoA (MazF antagonist)
MTLTTVYHIDAPARLHPVATGQPQPVNVPVRAIATAWCVTPYRVTRVGGDRNVHWVVHSRQGQYVLRCYRTDRDRAAIAYEFAVLAHLHRAGWPVAPPIGPLSTWNGRLFAMFPRLPGRPGRRPEQPARQRWRGALLAELHDALAPLSPGQRSGWRRLDTFIAQDAETLSGNARRRLADQEWLREPILRHTLATREALGDCPADLPMTVVHGDFVPWNMLWHRTTLTGLIDFDDARYDLRATDVALARRRDRDAVVGGYRDRRGLSDVEVALLAPLWRAYTLLYVADLVRAPVWTPSIQQALEWCVRELETTVPFRG